LKYESFAKFFFGEDLRVGSDRADFWRRWNGANRESNVLVAVDFKLGRREKNCAHHFPLKIEYPRRGGHRFGTTWSPQILRPFLERVFRLPTK